LKIVFITDGGEKMGMGHISRTLTLAGELYTRPEILFITSANDDIATGLITESGFGVINIASDDELKHSLAKLNPCVIIFDKLEVNENLVKELREKTESKLVLFENNSAANNYADIVVNAVVNSYFKNTRSYHELTGTLFFCGPKYWILRKEFFNFRNRCKQANSNIKRITMAFGGSDPANLSSKVLMELLNSTIDFQIDLCLGAHFMYVEIINSILDKYLPKSKHVDIHFNPQNIAEIMYNADLVITSPGTTAVEALFIGTPIVAISQCSNQEKVFKDYLNIINEVQLINIKKMIDTGDFIYPQQKDIQEAAIGEGKEDVLQAIRNLAVF
jgi:UDP-2,4-diacetamido-2,4,6-trideoxy-beta-L-altropyranose hydrolase